MAKDIYQSENFYLSVYLVYNNFPLINISKTDSSRKSFNFSNSPQLEEKVGEFFNFNKSIKVDLKKWLEKQKWLKSALYENN